MARPGFHRELLGALFAIVGGALAARLVFMTMPHPVVTVLATAAGALVGTWFAIRNYPQLGTTDAGLAAGVGILVLGAAYGAATPDGMTVFILLNATASALVAAGTAWAMSRGRPAGGGIRVGLAGLVVCAVSALVHAGIYALTSGELGLPLGAIVGGAVAAALVLEARLMEIVAGFATVFTLSATIGFLADTGIRGVGYALMIVIIGLVGGALCVALGAGLGMMLRPRPRIEAEAESVLPIARVED